jgi:hypothetical protein
MGRTPYKYRIKLSSEEKQELRQAKKKGRKDARLVIRILIILLADKGRTMAATAACLGCSEQTVLNWRKRFPERRSEGVLAALMDLPRSGRPLLYGAKERAQVTAMVCEASIAPQSLPRCRLAPGRREGRGSGQPEPGYAEPHLARKYA